MKNEPCIIFGLNFEHKLTKHIFRAGSLCQMDTFPLNHLTNRQKKIKSFSTREECRVFLLQELRDRKDFCCKRNLSHLVCGVKNRKPQSAMSFFRCLSPHSSTCPLVPGTHSIPCPSGQQLSPVTRTSLPTYQGHTHSIHCSYQ